MKCFLCRISYELRNCPKQFKLVVVKRKATIKLVESLEEFSRKEELRFAADLKVEVEMQTLKLGPIRLN